MNRTDQLLEKLESSHLVDPAVVAKLRAQVGRASRPVSPRAVLKLLLEKGHVTPVQAKRLLSEFGSAAPEPPPPAAEDSNIGLAPLDEDEPKSPASQARQRPPASDDVDLVAVDDDEDDEIEDLAPLDEEDPIEELVAIDEDDPLDQLVPIDDEDDRLDELAPLDDDVPAAVAPRAEAAEVGTLDESDLIDQPADDNYVVHGEIGEGDLLDDSPAAHDPGQFVEASQATSVKQQPRRGWQSKRVRKNVWDSPLLLVGGGTLALLVIMFVVLLWATSRGSGDDALAQANADFKSGSYTQAISKFDDYLNRFPGHHGVSTARVNRGLAVLRKAVEGTNDWPQALEVAKNVLKDIEAEEDFSSARPDLANLLPEIAEGLAQQAHRDPQVSLVEKSEEALSLVHGNVPTTLKNAVQLKSIEESLAFTRHTLARQSRTSEALAGIEAALETIQDETSSSDAGAAFEAAYRIRRELLRDYPELETVSDADDSDPAAIRTRRLAEQLAESILAVSSAEAQVVRFQSQVTDPLTEEPATAVHASVALARRRGQQVDSPSQVVFLLAEGSAYALDGTTGAPLWRRFVGFHTTFVPVALPGTSDVLLVDSLRHELVRVQANSGALRWRCPVAEEFDADPLIGRDTVLVATRSGRLARIDLETGRASGHTSFPQELGVAPAVSERKKLIYQIGEHSNIYVLSADDGQCREVAYLAHLPGTIDVPPALLGRYVIVIENDKLRDATIRVLLTDDDGLSIEQVQTQSLAGHVDTPPVVAGNGRLLFVTTDRGALYTFEIGTPARGNHLTPVAERAPVEETTTTRYPLVRGTQLWVAGRALTRYDIQAARGRLTPRRVIAGNSHHLQPPVAVGNAVIDVRRAPGLPGVVVSAHDAEDDDRIQPIWETTLAAPLAVPPRAESASAISAVNATGSYYVVDAGSPGTRSVVDSPSGSIDQVRPENLVPTSDRAVELGDGTLVVGEGLGENRLLLLDLAVANRPLRWLTVAQTVSASPVAFAGGLMIPGQEGMILVVDPSDGGNLIEPFQPPLSGGATTTWTRPEPIGDNEVVVSDGRSKIYRLGIANQPKPHLTTRAEATVSVPVAAPPAALENVVYLADTADTLMALDLPDLKPAGNWALGAPVAWGPQRVGELVLVATTAGELFCMDETKQLRWQVALAHGALAGAPLVIGESLILAHKSGAVARVSTETGQQQAAVVTHHPWATGAVRIDDRLLVGGHDGSLNLIDIP